MRIPNIIKLVLTPESRDKLFRFAPPKFSTIYGTHVTLAFKPSEELFKEHFYNFSEGQEFYINPFLHVISEGVQTVVVTTVYEKDHHVTNLFCQNKFPHITVSTDNKPPKLSNSILEKWKFEAETVIEHELLKGKLYYEFWR